TTTTTAPGQVVGEANGDVIFDAGSRIYRLNASGSTVLDDLTAGGHGSLKSWSIAPDGSVLDTWVTGIPSGGVNRIDEVTGTVSTLYSSVHVSGSSPTFFPDQVAGEANGDVIFDLTYGTPGVGGFVTNYQIIRLSGSNATVLYDLAAQGLTLTTWSLAPNGSVLVGSTGAAGGNVTIVNEATGQSATLYSAAGFVPAKLAGVANGDVAFTGNNNALYLYRVS